MNAIRVGCVGSNLGSTSSSPIPGLEIVVLVNDGYQEIVGIRNTGNASTHIGGWTLDGSHGNDACTIPDGAWLSAGITCQIAAGRSAPGQPGHKCRAATIWRNSGQTTYLQPARPSLLGRPNIL